MKPWQHVTLGAVGGSLLALGAVYLYFQSLANFLNQAKYLEAASQARMHVKALEHLNNGNTSEAGRVVDGLLRGNEALMTMYESTHGATTNKLGQEVRGEVDRYRATRQP
ncbi:MAG: hypothetical protein QM808_02765 [Steroidobacteraceae bacterium]